MLIPGKLDLASLSLTHLPPAIYTELLGLPAEELSRPPPKEMPTQHLGPKRVDALVFEDTEENKHNVFGTPPPKPRWREPEELTSFRAGYNMIKEVEVELGLFGGLKTLDVRGLGKRSADPSFTATSSVHFQTRSQICSSFNISTFRELGLWGR